MKKSICIAAVLYGLGFAGAAIARTASLWDSMGSASLIEEALISGLTWPVGLVEWLV